MNSEMQQLEDEIQTLGYRIADLEEIIRDSRSDLSKMRADHHAKLVKLAYLKSLEVDNGT